MGRRTRVSWASLSRVDAEEGRALGRRGGMAALAMRLRAADESQREAETEGEERHRRPGPAPAQDEHRQHAEDEAAGGGGEQGRIPPGETAPQSRQGRGPGIGRRMRGRRHGQAEAQDIDGLAGADVRVKLGGNSQQRWIIPGANGPNAAEDIARQLAAKEHKARKAF